MTEPRDLAVQALYRADQLGLRAEDVHDDLTGKARRLVDGTLAVASELDEVIDRVSDRWRIDRMPAVDRAVLRLALYELRYERDTPVAVILNEAVRIAKEFSTARSGTFVNGVLAKLAETERNNSSP